MTRWNQKWMICALKSSWLVTILTGLAMAWPARGDGLAKLRWVHQASMITSWAMPGVDGVMQAEADDTVIVWVERPGGVFAQPGRPRRASGTAATGSAAWPPRHSLERSAA
jgi:hypothetical protein